MKKKMNKIIVIAAIIICLTTSSFVLFMQEKSKQEGGKSEPDLEPESDPEPEPEPDPEPEPEPEIFDGLLIVSQSNLQLDNEYIQYKILFHNSDTIDVKIRMHYEVKTLDNLFYLVYLADGKDELTYKTFLRHEPVGMIDITLGKHIKILPKASSDENTFDRTFHVEKNDIWYLTVAVYKSMNETIEISLNSDNATMEATILGRGNRLGYFTVQDGDFSGKILSRYRGISIFGLGYSRCHVTKTIKFEKGTLFYSNIDRFLDATLIVTQPNGKSYQHATKKVGKLIQENTHHYEGMRITGEWTFLIKGIGFPCKLTASVFYVDVDPYGDINMFG